MKYGLETCRIDFFLITKGQKMNDVPEFVRSDSDFGQINVHIRKTEKLMFPCSNFLSYVINFLKSYFCFSFNQN